MTEPSIVTEGRIESSVEALLRAESWDELTVKVVMRKLEQGEELAGGTLKPHKKLVKEAVDAMMKKIMTEREAQTSAEAAATEAEKPPEPTAPEADNAMDTAEATAPAEASEAPAASEEPAPEDEAPRKKKQKVIEEPDDEPDDEPAAKEEAPAEEEAKEEEEEAEEEEEEDPDAAQTVGKPTHKADGKVFYQKMIKDDKELAVGQDVYLENDMDIPYVARLQQIFTYSFAPKEVYFNARWYYRVNDVHEYAEMAGAKGKVEWEGDELAVEPSELFFSMHMDENHSDTILRATVVHLVDDSPTSAMWSQLSQHQYMAWRAYDNKSVYSLSELPSKKLRDAYQLERKRTKGSAPVRDKKPEKPRVVIAEGPLSRDELRSTWLSRKHIEVWHETDQFVKVVTNTLVRSGLTVNGKRTFFVGKVVGLKRASQPYKLGKKVVDIALQVRTHNGVRLTGIDTLSNQAPSDAELDALRIPLEPTDVRKKIYKLETAMRDASDLFEEEELRWRAEAAERQAEAQAERQRAAELAQEERDRKERDREELQQRAARKSQGNEEQWWLKFQKTDKGDKEREMAKWKARLLRFEKIASSSAADGERDNARRLAEQAQQKIASLEAQAEAGDPMEADAE